MKHLNIKLIPDYIIVSFPLIILFGQFLSNTLAIIFSIYSIILLFLLKKNNFHFFSDNKFFLLFFLFFIFGLFSSFVNHDNYLLLSLKSNLSILLSIFFIFGVYYKLNNSKLDILYYFSYTLLVSFIFILSIFIFDFVFVNDYFFNEANYYADKNNLRALHRFIFENEIMGSFIIRFYPLLICFTLIFFTNKKALIIFLFFSSFILIIFSFQRIIIIQFLIANFLLLFFLKNIRFLISILLSSCIILFIAFDLHNYTTKGKSFIQVAYNQIYSDSKFYFYSPHHQGHYITSLKMIKKNLFYGIGTNQFRHKCSEEDYIYIYRTWIDQETNTLIKADSCSSHPHNYFIQIFSENGIFSFFLLIYLYFIILFYIFKYKSFKDTNNKFLFLGSSITILTVYFPLVPSHNFYHGWTNLPILLTIGILLFSYQKQKEFIEDE